MCAATDKSFPHQQALMPEFLLRWGQVFSCTKKIARVIWKKFSWSAGKFHLPSWPLGCLEKLKVLTSNGLCCFKKSIFP